VSTPNDSGQTGKKWVVGIDLGTTHTAVARAQLGVERARPESVAVTQLVAAGQVEAKALLPSCLYLPIASEGPQRLPWDAERAYAVGEYARSRGADAAARVVASAKSWLIHPSVDRRSAILPQGAPDDVEAISPVEASFRYLEHVAESFEHDGSGPLGEQEVVLTVPASFDAAARELTVEAATAAGLEHLTLLEEPQAALYAWIDAMGDRFRKELFVGDVVLVVDVGGGTTDFSAIEVRDDGGGSFELARVAIGDHILLGGDNMDLAIGHVAKAKLVASGKEIDKWQLAQLVHAARGAKERLLGDATIAEASVAIAGRGSQLVGSSLKTTIDQDAVQKILVDGFFPEVGSDARPVVRARGALTQIGLPYAQDPAVTKHLAAFLARQAGAIASTGAKSGTASDRAPRLLCPTAVLFNGGVMKSARLRDRIMKVLATWCEGEGRPAPRVLDGADYDAGVARGAAYYGLARRGQGLRIRGGTARAYYVGIEGAVPAVPGMEPPVVALCVAPFGMEEGSDAGLVTSEMGVVVGEPVRFRFFGSTVRRTDKVGTELEDWPDGELEELPPIEVSLPAEGRREGEVVPVRLAASVTEVGTLAIEAVPVKPAKPDERWKVELSVRGDGADGSSGGSGAAVA
jgi:actin-like ATPase involved in cell morphogenesis